MLALLNSHTFNTRDSSQPKPVNQHALLNKLIGKKPARCYTTLEITKLVLQTDPASARLRFGHLSQQWLCAAYTSNEMANSSSQSSLLTFQVILQQPRALPFSVVLVALSCTFEKLGNTVQTAKNMYLQQEITNLNCYFLMSFNWMSGRTVNPQGVLGPEPEGSSCVSACSGGPEVQPKLFSSFLSPDRKSWMAVSIWGRKVWFIFGSTTWVMILSTPDSSMPDP